MNKPLRKLNHFFILVKQVLALNQNIFTDRSKVVLLLWIIYVISVWFLLCFRARLFIDAMWSPAGKGLASWLSFLMSKCEVDTFPLVSLVLGIVLDCIDS